MSPISRPSMTVRPARAGLSAIVTVLGAITLCSALSGCDSERSVRIATSGTGEEASGGPLRVVETLECPQTEGVLTRTQTSADGLSCTYSGPRGASVTLRLVRFSGEAIGALDQLEGDVRALTPAAYARLNAGSGTSASISATAEGASAEDAATPAAERSSVRLPGLSVRTEGDNAVVRLPGVSIDTMGNEARVRIGGLSINANDDTGSVNVSSDQEAVTVLARDDATEIRTRNLQGGVRSTYIVIDERAISPEWRLVGFEARGPLSGPLIVAIVQTHDRREDETFSSAKALVTRNVGP
ncbi:MAG: methyltransferase type 11 [Brevundimonas sp.]|uniref:methyltransferase type 11 n=1 Tax=Brevundimonas sp. TaxID=1871086 RepID=UPI00391A0F6A